MMLVDPRIRRQRTGHRVLQHGGPCRPCRGHLRGVVEAKARLQRGRGGVRSNSSSCKRDQEVRNGGAQAQATL